MIDQLITISVVTVLAGGVRAAVPLYLAAVGEVFAERSGVMNVGVEGIMLLGAMLGVVVQTETGSTSFAIGATVLAGGLVGALFCLVTVYWHANQIAAGIALIFLGTGISALGGMKYVGQKIAGINKIDFPLLRDLPVLGPILFRHDPLCYLALASIPILSIIMFKTRLGLLIRAAGEDPAAAERLGINVRRIRLIAVSFGGACAGLAGGYLSLSYAHMWKENMVAGRGLIALALAIFAAWKPGRSALGALLFGTITAFQLRLQASGSGVSPYILDMMPYLITISVLIVSVHLTSGRGGAPLALGKSYRKGEYE